MGEEKGLASQSVLEELQRQTTVVFHRRCEDAQEARRGLKEKKKRKAKGKGREALPLAQFVLAKRKGEAG